MPPNAQQSQYAYTRQNRHFHLQILLKTLPLVILAMPLFSFSAYAAEASLSTDQEYSGLVCRGVEESGGSLIGNPGFGPHLISLFATGPNPHASAHTLAEHVAWVNDPLHSYIADGTGGLCIWAHPADSQAQDILALPGLTGLEVNHAGHCLLRDKLWDAVLRGCLDQSRPFLWGFAADDTHSFQKIELSWYAARLDELSEFALKRALRQGAFYISSGPVINDVQVQAHRITLHLEQPADVFWLRAGQFLAPEPAPQIEVTPDPGQNHSIQWDKDTRQSTLNLDTLHISIDQLHFVRAVVRADPSTIAHTQPWRIASDGSVDNPYPQDGLWVRGQTHNHTDTWADHPSRLPEFRPPKPPSPLPPPPPSQGPTSQLLHRLQLLGDAVPILRKRPHPSDSLGRARPIRCRK